MYRQRQWFIHKSLSLPVHRNNMCHHTLSFVTYSVHQLPLWFHWLSLYTLGLGACNWTGTCKHKHACVVRLHHHPCKMTMSTVVKYQAKVKLEVLHSTAVDEEHVWVMRVTWKGQKTLWAFHRSLESDRSDAMLFTHKSSAGMYQRKLYQVKDWG